MATNGPVAMMVLIKFEVHPCCWLHTYSCGDARVSSLGVDFPYFGGGWTAGARPFFLLHRSYGNV